MTGQEIYETILASNIINFIIMVSVLTFIFKKFKLGVIVDSFAEDIKNNVNSSAQMVQNALKEYKEARRETKKIPSKKEEILNSAKEVIEKNKLKNDEEIEQKQAELNKNAEKTHSAMYEKQIRNTANEIQEAIYKLSTDTIKSNLTYEIQNKIIENCLNELDNMHGIERQVK